MTPVEFFDMLIRGILDVTYIPWAAAGVLVVVAVVKLVLTKANIQFNPVLLTIAVQVVVWVLFQVFKNQLGLEVEFQKWYMAFITILQALMGLVGSTALSHKWYEDARNAKNPILGYRGAPKGALKAA